MVNILDPQEGESIYDPTCGTGGMLLEAVQHVKANHGDDRTLWGTLFDQEQNLTTSAIARMNLFLHGASDFQIVRGDTLRNPAFFLGDSLATFDCVIANPPFSLEMWGEEVWTSDPFGRNFAGMPPGKSGDYAWVQHMIKSMAAGTGRMAVVLPHGALFRMGTHLRRQKKEWRKVKLFGQERNLMTSSIARMNCFLHGIEDFRIERGDTLAEPKLVSGDRLMRFDVCLANPPYSIKQWDRDAFGSDPWGRNLYGTPPQGRADYAFWQHIQCSLAPKTGRCAILFPHGVLFRQEEAEMRRKLIEADAIECVLGLGPNLFYNSPMEACVVICRTAKPKARKGKILFINAVNEVTRERAQSFLTDDHIERFVKAYEQFQDEPGFTRVATLEEIRAKDGNLSIPLYITPLAANGSSATADAGKPGLSTALGGWLESSMQVRTSLQELLAKGQN